MDSVRSVICSLRDVDAQQALERLLCVIEDMGLDDVLIRNVKKAWADNPGYKEALEDG